MAGSQLKKLKAALKESGLTGQQNVKRKNTKRAPSDMRRDDRHEVINKIRDQFNPFEIKTNNKKTDRDYQSMKGAQGKPGISKQVGEEQRKLAYEAKKQKKGRNSALLDKRFGERDSDLTAEQKMLERYTRERQIQASKSSLYNLESDDEEEFSGGLTHYGKTLALNDDFEQEEDLNNGSDDEIFKPIKRSVEEQSFSEEKTEEPARKKTKAEVMKEVMAKSKFYKQQRQLLKEQNDEKIMELDDDFQDVLQELGSIPRQKVQQTFSSNDGLNYEKSIKELNMERKAAPADRTKTEEEIKRERMAKMRELEEQRLRRMRGQSEEDGDKQADDLDDDFWVQGSDEEGFAIQNDEVEVASEDDQNEDESGDFDQFAKFQSTKKLAISCPEDHEEFLNILDEVELSETINLVNKILQTYAPRLNAGNKEKTANFTVVLFQHILYLAEYKTDEQYDNKEFVEVEEELIRIVKKLSEKYNNELTQFLRAKIQEIQERIQETLTTSEREEEEAEGFPFVSDLVFFGVVGLIFSTSDHYHLVVTPLQIIFGEILNQFKVETLKDLASGLFISETFLQYQRFSKRYIPEVTGFLQKALLTLYTPKLLKNDKQAIKPDTLLELSFKDSKQAELRITELNHLKQLDTNSVKYALLIKLVSIIEKAIETWKDKTAFIEIFTPIQEILTAIIAEVGEANNLTSLSLKLKRLLGFAQDDRKPLELQTHKKLAIASFAPKFEENFNPDKKSYDEDRSKQELNKMRKQIKQERKFTMKELRKDTRFEARQQISEKKKQYKDYHTKMARIMNTINTVEGAEKNEYAREKKQRKGK